MKKLTIVLALLMLCMTTSAMAQTYTAASQGFGGEVAVTLEIEGGKLLSVTAQGDNETQGIGTRALEMLPAAMMEGNTVDVDTVSGATVTSNAVKVAAVQALAQSGEMLAPAEQAEAAKMVPGVYTGSAKGFHGDVKVEIEVTEDAITRVTVGENGETMYVGTLAFPILEESIVANQSLADTVSGATFTSNAINGAVVQAIQAAGANSATVNAFLGRRIPVENPGDIETDVVVVGAGVAGMSAAMNAYDQGAKVILLEKTDMTGGSARLSAGCVLSIDAQELKEDEHFTVDDVYTFFNEYAGPVHSKEIFDAVVGNTKGAIDYLRENGYVVGATQKSHEKVAPQFTSLSSAGMGPGLAESMTAAVKSRDIDLRFNSPAVELVMNEDGSVGGVVVENEAGRYTIKADKVILAAGGFTYDDEMMAQYAAGRDRNNMYWTAIGAEGDGHKMGIAAGGKLVGEGTLAIHAIDGRLDSFFDMFALWNIPMIVDKDGKQMAAMDEHYTTIAAKINEKEDSMGYTIYDSDTYGCTELLEALAAQGSITKADTLAELAEISGINADELEKTIAAHNQHVIDQTDDEWGTPAAALQPIDAAPYYCVPRRSVVMGTVTGLEVNTDMQVLREDGTAIDNLYATGEMIFGNMFNMIYPMSGTAIGTCISSGQLAALHACANLK